MIDPDRACPHEHFQTYAAITRLTASDDDPEIIGYCAEIRVWCVDCDEPFRWIGLPAGMRADRPACSVDETELRAPIRPASSDPDFGMGLPGFSVRYEGDVL